MLNVYKLSQNLTHIRKITITIIISTAMLLQIEFGVVTDLQYVATVYLDLLFLSAAGIHDR